MEVGLITASSNYDAQYEPHPQISALIETISRPRGMFLRLLGNVDLLSLVLSCFYELNNIDYCVVKFGTHNENSARGSSQTSRLESSR